MTECQALRAEVEQLVDGELSDAVRAELLRHMQTCAECRTFFQEAEQLSLLVRATKDQTHAPQALRTRVEQIVSQHPVQAPAVGRWRASWKQAAWPFAAAAAVLLFVIAASPIRKRSQQQRGAEMIQAAIQIHESLLASRTQLSIATESDAIAADWLNQHAPFHFEDANAGVADVTQAKYKLQGATLTKVGGQIMDVLSFRLPDQAISMLVAPGGYAVDQGNTVVHSGGISLYSQQVGNLHLVSWKNRGLSYVLVAPVSMGNPNSCGHCHAGAAAERQEKADLDLYRPNMAQVTGAFAAHTYIARSQQWALPVIP